MLQLIYVQPVSESVTPTGINIGPTLVRLTRAFPCALMTKHARLSTTVTACVSPACRLDLARTRVRVRTLRRHLVCDALLAALADLPPYTALQVCVWNRDHGRWRCSGLFRCADQHRTRSAHDWGHRSVHWGYTGVCQQHRGGHNRRRGWQQRQFSDCRRLEMTHSDTLRVGAPICCSLSSRNV